MYDYQRAADDGYIAPRNRLLAEIAAWRVINEPGAPFHIWTLRMRLRQLERRRNQEIGDRAFSQMRFWRPAGREAVRVLHLSPDFVMAQAMK